MILLDTDVLTLLFQGHERVVDRMQSSEDDVTTSVITWIEVLQGRFAAILKAAGTEQLLQAQDRLQQTIESFASLPIVPIDRAGAEQFDKLLRSKKLKKLGRGDL